MQSVVHRYYDVFHATKENISALREGEEFSIYQHHNGLCILCLGPSHPIRTKSLRVIKVDFDVGSQNRAKNAVTGKRKKGGIQLHPDTAVCKVYTEPEENPAKKQKISEESTSTTQEEEPAEQVWTIRACVRGFLVEPNRSLVDNPKLLEEKVGQALMFHLLFKATNSCLSACYRWVFCDYHASPRTNKNSCQSPFPAIYHIFTFSICVLHIIL